MDPNKKQNKRRLYNKKWMSEKRRKQREQSELDTDSDAHQCSSFVQDENPNENIDDTQNAPVLNDQQMYDDAPLDNINTAELGLNFVADITSSNDESDDCDEDTALIDTLREWVNTHEIKASAVDDLLKRLKKTVNPNIPCSSRTLLKTPRSVDLQRISDMDYFHFGLELMILNTLKKYRQTEIQALNSKLILSLNIDGLPLFKSSKTSAWPVLGLICNLKPPKPFPITLTVGISKPSNLEFLHETIADINSLITNGIDFNEEHFEIKLLCIICDAPAKAFVKCVKQYSGYYGCDKCEQRGQYVGRMTYPITENLVYRTNVSFRNQTQEEHHKDVCCPFLDLPMDMIKDFPVDYMHQVCLGVMKKLLITWMRGPRANNRLSSNQVAQISAKLISFVQYIPQEFARKPRGLEEVDRWKATEFRQFLIYTGQFALRGVLSNNLYKHFMCLCVAITILVNEDLVLHYATYAHRLLCYFVRNCGRLYGEEFCVYNVHALLHLKSEADTFGSLEKCAAWPFENYMQQLKRKVRGGNNPAAQLVKRIFESMETDVIPD